MYRLISAFQIARITVDDTERTSTRHLIVKMIDDEMLDDAL